MYPVSSVAGLSEAGLAEASDRRHRPHWGQLQKQQKSW